jgi:AGZA family xanthine/uracil permease-like MFS transporter
MLPALAYLILISLNMALGLRDPDPAARLMVQTLRCLAGGFIITSLIWAAALAMLIDGWLVRAAGFFLLAGLFALFGVIHSPLRNEQIDLPSRVLGQIPESFQEAITYQTPYHWAGAYGLIVLMLLGLASFPSTRANRRTTSPLSSVAEDEDKIPSTHDRLLL